MRNEITHFMTPLRPRDIFHHSVKNQKWGVQNGPPYPLDSSISTGKKLKDTQTNLKGSKSKEKRVTGHPDRMIDYSKGFKNARSFEAETFPKMKEWQQLGNEAFTFQEKHNKAKADELWAKQTEKLKEVAQTKAMKEFFGDKKVKTLYEERNKHYDEARTSADPDETYFAAAKKWDTEIKQCIKKFFGSEAQKPFSKTNKNTYEKLMERILEELDCTSNSVDNVFPYGNIYAWRWYS